MSVSEDRVTVELEREPGQPWRIGFAARQGALGQGLYITSLSPEHQDKDLRIGDRIVSVNGRTFQSKVELTTLMTAIASGQLALEVSRVGGGHSRVQKEEAQKPGTPAATEPKLMMVKTEREEGQPIGANVDENLVVTKVMEHSLADDILLPGDTVKAVNGRAVATPEEFYRRLKIAHPMLEITILRDPSKMSELQTSQLPEKFEKMLKRRAGFAYLIVEIDWTAAQNRQLGLALSNRTNKVIVSALKPSSLAAEKFKLMDHLIAINDTRVSDKDVAKQMIIAFSGKFTSVVERPVSDAAVKELKDMMAVNTSIPAPINTDILPADVQMLAEAERERRQTPVKARPSILRRSSSEETRLIQFHPKHQEIHIQSDVDPRKVLRQVPKA